MKLNGGQLAVPTIAIDGNVMVGFDQARVKSLLGLS